MVAQVEVAEAAPGSVVRVARVDREAADLSLERLAAERGAREAVAASAVLAVAVAVVAGDLALEAAAVELAAEAEPALPEAKEGRTGLRARLPDDG